MVEAPRQEAIPSQSEFTMVKEGISKIKKDIWRIKGYMQHSFNTTVDMHGLAAEFNVLTAFHKALFTTLKEVADAKMVERGPPR